MIDLGREISRAVRADWNDGRARSAKLGVRRRQRQRLVRRTVLGSTVAVAMVAGLCVLWPRVKGVSTIAITATPTPIPTATATSTATVTSIATTTSTATSTSTSTSTSASKATPLHFADTSTARPTGSDGQLHLVSEQPDGVTVDLVAGGGQFQIVDNRARVFRVTSGGVTIESFGAMFAASREEQKARVEVWDGTVRVLWDGRARELTAGEIGVFPPDTAVTTPTKSPPSVPAHVVKSSWRDLARDGDYDRAYAALRREAPTLRDDVEELLLAADVQRLSHHPDEAVAPLRQVLRDHAQDPRASLAAFTLGRVLLDELAQPADAANAFIQADRLAPDGPMAEDAIARAVEALSRAGDAANARRLAEDYLKRFPAGRKAKSVKRLGALE
jgi:transmembrane sensor